MSWHALISTSAVAGGLALALTGAPAVAKGPVAPADSASPVQAPIVDGSLPYRYMSGLEVLRLDPFKLLVSRGSAVDNSGKALIQIEHALTLDIRNVGPAGRDDVASPQDLQPLAEGLTPDVAAPNGYRANVDGAPAPGWYHIVYMRDPVSKANSAILTRQISSMRLDRPGDARPPANFTLRRHAPVAYYYDAKTGFRPQVCYAWPQPICVFTTAGIRKEFAAAEDLAAPEWTTISLARFMPDTARIVRLQAVVTGVGGAGAAYARTLPQRQGSIFLGRAREAGDKQTLIFEITTNSRETIAVKTDPGVVVSIYAVAFAMAQTY